MLHQRLREATAEAHQRMEARLNIMEPTLTRARYGRILRTFYSIYVPLEKEMLRACAGTDLEAYAQERVKRGRLEADLQALGYTCADVEAISPSPHVPHLDGAPGALGALYVMEGATLGGQFIARHVQRVLGLTPANGAAFFTGEGPGTAAQWKRFRELLAAQPEGSTQAVVTAAVATFECFDKTFAGVE